MTKEKEEVMSLDWVRKISIRSLMGLTQEQLRTLQLQADKELFRAQLTKDWIDSAIKFKLWECTEDEFHDKKEVH